MKRQVKYIVRTNKDSWSKAMTGKIYKSYELSKYSTMYNLAGGWQIHKSNCRDATQQEIYAYKQGIRNVKDIPKQQQYEIY